MLSAKIDFIVVESKSKRKFYKDIKSKTLGFKKEGLLKQLEIDHNRNKYKNAIKDFVSSGRVVLSTLITIGSPVMNKQNFEVAMVDEAGTISAPEMVMALNTKIEKLILAGDPLQIGPENRNMGIKSAFKMAIENGVSFVL